MLTLVVDTSTPAVTAAVAHVTADNIEVTPRVLVDPRAHGEMLTPLLQAAMEKRGVTMAEVDAVIGGVGPGPFTGLRAGLATAAGLAAALRVPSYGVCSLDGIGAATSGRVLAATDARRKEIYWAVYVDGKREGDPEVSKPAELPLRARDIEAVYGDGAHRHAAALSMVPRAEPRFPVPENMARLAADRVRDGAPSEALTPQYLRRPSVHVAGQSRRL